MANDGGETAARIYEAGRTGWHRILDERDALRVEVASLLSQLREARASEERGWKMANEMKDAVLSLTAIRERAEQAVELREARAQLEQGAAVMTSDSVPATTGEDEAGPDYEAPPLSPGAAAKVDALRDRIAELEAATPEPAPPKGHAVWCDTKVGQPCDCGRGANTEEAR